MQTGYFEKQIVLTPDLCGSAAALSPLAAFTIFQGVASEHAEKIGVGGAAMAKRGKFVTHIDNSIVEKLRLVNSHDINVGSHQQYLRRRVNRC